MYLSSSGIAVKSFAAPEVWSTLIQVFVVLLAVLAGNTLRRKVRFRAAASFLRLCWAV